MELISMHDRHTPQRWGQQNPNDKLVWNVFDSSESRALVTAALENPKCNLFDLYFALSKLREKCELVKTQTQASENLTTAEIEYFARMPSYIISDDCEFGRMAPPSRCMAEGDLDKPEFWEIKVRKLTQQRARITGDDAIRDKLYNVALSTIINPTNDYSELSHRQGDILHKLEPIFQKLVQADNISDFIINASALIYTLSNYTPLMRGSAAVSNWLIENIYQHKFGEQLGRSYRPLIQDWVAFYESEQVYKTYYAISVTANILSSFDFVKQNPEYLQKLQNWESISIENPYLPGNMDKRAGEWKEMQLIIRDSLANHALSSSQRSQLQSLAEMSLTFFKTSSIVERLISILEKPDQYAVYKSMLQDLHLSAEDFNQIKIIMQLHETLADDHIKKLGVAEIDGQTWHDLEVLRLHLQKNASAMLALKDYVGIEKSANLNNPMVKRSPQLNNSLMAAAFLTMQDYENLSPKFKELLARGHQFNEQETKIICALNGAGIKLQDLDKFTEQQLDILLSPQALLLYHANRFISAEDIADNNIEIMKAKIVNLSGKVICNENWASIMNQPDIINAIFTLPPGVLSSGLFRLNDVTGNNHQETVNNINNYRWDYLMHYHETRQQLIYSLQNNLFSEAEIKSLHHYFQCQQKLSETQTYPHMLVQTLLPSEPDKHGIELHQVTISQQKFTGVTARFTDCDIYACDFRGCDNAKELLKDNKCFACLTDDGLHFDFEISNREQLYRMLDACRKPTFMKYKDEILQSLFNYLDARCNNEGAIKILSDIKRHPIFHNDKNNHAGLFHSKCHLELIQNKINEKQTNMTDKRDSDYRR